MTWFKVDDGFYSHEKVVSIPRGVRAEAIGTWTLCGTWSAAKDRDGFVPAHMIEELGASSAGAEALVSAGLWKRRRGGGFQFVNWEKYQPTVTSKIEKRKSEAQRQADYRARNANDSKGSSQRDSDGVTDAYIPPVPVPVPVPDPKEVKNTSSPTGDGSFDAFYESYPRKVGKEAARRAYEKAIKSTRPEVILEGVRRYAADSNLPEKKFVPYPAKWLNGGQWDDEPQPERDDDPWGGKRQFGGLPSLESRIPPDILSKLHAHNIPAEEYFEEKDDPAWREKYGIRDETDEWMLNR